MRYDSLHERPLMEPAREAIVRAMLTAGWSNERVAKVLDYSVDSIRKWRRRYGIAPLPAQPVARAVGHRRRWSEQEIGEMAWERMELRWSVPRIATVHHTSLRTVQRYLPWWARSGQRILPGRRESGAYLREWHRRLTALGLPHDGTYTIRDGQPVRTQRPYLAPPGLRCPKYRRGRYETAAEAAK